VLPRDNDQEKAAAAAVFYEKYVLARENDVYGQLRQEHVRRFG
jgi:hypothetical protein